MLELAARESSFDNTNKNPESTAYGLFQFLDGTWGDTGISRTSDPYQQAVAAIRYIKNRPNYGDPYKALSFWDANKWY
jgi:muramidase (phage lysozyme)